jgi:hypothetical protein
VIRKLLLLVAIAAAVALLTVAIFVGGEVLQ